MAAVVVPEYIHHPHHRDTSRANEKSQWAITIEQEAACFVTAFTSSWGADERFWGLHIVGSAPSVLGSTPVEPRAYIAKFVGPTWHGYPVAPWVAPYDRPTVDVLNMWEAEGHIDRPAKSRIARGKACAL